MRRTNGDLCNGKPGEVQVFLYKVDNPEDHDHWTYTQQKLEHFDEYVLSPEEEVPPGDCLIIEFDQPKDHTDKMCNTYNISMEKGEMNGG